MFRFEDEYNFSNFDSKEDSQKPVFVRKPTIPKPEKPDESGIVRKISGNEDSERTTPPPLVRPYSEDKQGDQRLYEVTLDSKSSFGSYSSKGKAALIKIGDYSYELKAVLYPQNPGLIGISKPYFVHAVVTTSQGTFGGILLKCNGYAHITKLFSSTLPADNIKVDLNKPVTSHVNEYKFSLNPITLFGMSPGKTTNSGRLVLLSKTVDKESEEELAFCDKIKLSDYRIKPN